METASGFTSVNTPSSAPPAPPPPAPSDPAPATGTKRKRDVPMKFYAVRIGKEPGIYHTWTECLEQVKGFPKALFKSFPSLAEAQSFVDGESDHTSGVGNGSGKVGGGTPQKWYGVRVGRVPGVYTSWHDVLDQIRGWKGPKHRGFKTRIEAELFVKEGQQHGIMNGGDAMDSIEAPAHKKSKITKNGGLVKDENASPDFDGHGFSEHAPGEGPLNGREDDFDTSIILSPTSGNLRYKTSEERSRVKYQAVRPVLDAPIRIYTDGSSLSNGQEGAMGGVGVYFGPGDKRNVSEGLAGSKQTNQRAELTAILRALEIAPKDRRIILLSDSNYAIKCSNEWFQTWRSNGWVNSAKRPVENRDLVQKIVDNLEDRYQMNRHRNPLGFSEEDDNIEGDPIEDDGKPAQYWERGPAGVKFVWVKGHAKDEGNNAADNLATAGAREARELIEGDVDID